MAITFHCNHCGKKIEAQDNAGGKWGTCPACHNKLYIPDLTEDEELKLSPIDKTEEEREKQLMAETHKLTQDILLERKTPDDAGPSTSQVSEKELTKNIILYLRQMANGELEQARDTANLLIPHAPQAEEILDRIALSEMPEPELADIPAQVLAGLIRDFRSRIS